MRFHTRSLFPVVLLTFFCVIKGQSLEEYLQQARSLAEANQFESALQVLETALQEHPESPQVLLQLGGLLVRLGKLEQGDELLEKALDRLPFHPEALKERAQVRLQQGDLEQAAALLRKSLWYEPDNAETHYRLAFTLFVRGDETEALEHGRRSVESDPLAGPYRRFYSLLLEIHGDREESFRQLRMAYRLDPGNPQTLYRLSRAERNLGNLGQAIEYSELASRQDPENPLYLNELAELYRKAGNQDLAANAEERAGTLATAYRDYVEAIRLTREGRDREAVHLLENRFPDPARFPTGALLLADLHSRLGAEERALEVYSEVLAADPSRSRAREESAWIHVRRGSVEAALDLLEDSKDPGITGTFLLGYQHFLNRRWAEALQQFQRVQSAYPLTPGLLQLISSCLDEMDQNDEAVRILNKAAEIQPGDPSIQRQARGIQLERAVRAQEAHDWGSAISILEKLTSEDPGNSLYRLNLAYALQKLGRLEEAVEMYRSGLARDPSAGWARINLATSLYLLTRFEEALAEWEEVTSRNPTPEYLLQLGLCYSQLQRDPEAEAAFERALKRGLDTPELLYNLGITRLRLSKTGEARELIRRAARQGYPPAVDLLLRQPR